MSWSVDSTKQLSKLAIVLLTSLVILSSAASCTLFGGQSLNLGVLKRENLDGKGYKFNFINTERKYTGEIKTNNLSTASGLKMIQTSRNNLYLLTEKNGFFRTTDGGQNWERKYLFAFESTSSDKRQIQKDINNWLQKNDRFIATDFNVSLFSQEVVYLAGQFEEFGRIFKTENGGNTFRLIYSGIEPKGFVRFVSTDPNDPERVFAVTGQNTLIRSNNGGETWEKLYTFEGKTIVQLGFYNDESESLFVLLKKEGLAISEDLGKTWEIKALTKDKQLLSEKPKGIFGKVASKSDSGFVEYEKIVPINKGEYWLLIADDNLWFSDSLSKTFLKMLLPTEAKKYEIYDVVVYPREAPDRMLVAINNKLYESKDGGRTWSAEDKIGLSKPIGNIGQILIDLSNEEVIYLMLVDKKVTRQDGLYQKTSSGGLFRK